MTRDDTPIGDARVCPVLIGREGAVASLDAALQGAAAGRGGITLVAGDPGIGKTRLIGELCTRAAGQGFLVVRGDCFESDRTLPYAPFIDLLNTSLLPVIGRERLTSLLASEARTVARLSPLLGVGRIEPSRGPEEERRRLFDAVSAMLLALSINEPLLVVVEDLHWSDDSSCELLLFLARALPTMRVALIATYRPDEVHPALAHLLAELDRRRLASELSLHPLSRAEVALMVRTMEGSHERTPPAFAADLFALTDGNPLFVEELLRSIPRHVGEIAPSLIGRTSVPEACKSPYGGASTR